MEAVIGENGAVLALDRILPTEVVSDLYFVSENGRERELRQVADGRVTGIGGLQGHALRLRPDGAHAFRTLTWPQPAPGHTR